MMMQVVMSDCRTPSKPTVRKSGRENFNTSVGQGVTTDHHDHEQTFRYGNHILKGHLARITENTPNNHGVVIFSITDVPLGFGMCMKTPA